MKSEIQIILDSQDSYKQGNCFERLVRDIIELHRYKVHSNVNYTGMELDLTAIHKDRNHELLYVECKAKEKVSSSEILSFEAKVRLRNANYGYFIRTKELDHQAAGLVDELNNQGRYHHLTFFEPKKVIDLLEDANKIKKVKLENINVTKEILAVTYFGDFFIYLVKNSLGAIPESFLMFNAASGASIDKDADVVELIKERIDEVKDLELKTISTPSLFSTKENITEVEAISEVQESEYWFDYLPASSKHFVGRISQRNQMFDYFKDVLNKQTSRRIFYLTGKSGWGKSSLVAEIRGRCRNKFYKNKFFTLAIDSRSATSANFVALSFEKLINTAIKEDFIKTTLFNSIQFTSNVDLLSSDSIVQLLSDLEKQKKILILIFDQFEDVFRKPGLFKSFYKFLSDVTDIKSNLIIGFSWKTEILIPSENEAYHYWQQAKEQAISFSVPEFGSQEINGIISQLETSTVKLSQELKRRIIESSQSLPWLTKKLCIHIYKQIEAGVKPEKLIDDNLNIKSLFESDLEILNGEELSTLKYIANKAADGNFLDITEIGEKVSDHVIDSLRDKRFIIRSGSNYTIYWDIFRDYLITSQVPAIGESYILRQGVNNCLETFLLFGNNDVVVTMDELVSSFPRKIKRSSLENILIELRNIGLIYKLEGLDSYKITSNSIQITRDGFINYITNKFLNYTVYFKLQKLETRTITSRQVSEILKDTFKAYNFEDKTWDIYALYLIGWLLFSNVPLKPRIIEPKKGRKNETNINLRAHRSSLLIRSSLNEIVQELKRLSIDNSKIKNVFQTDFYLLELIDQKGLLTDKALALNKLLETEQKKVLVQQTMEFEKMKTISDILNANPKMTAKSLVKTLPVDFFRAKKESSKVVYASKILTWYKNSSTAQNP